MGHQFLRVAVFLLFFSVIVSCDDEIDPKILVKDYSEQVGDLHNALGDFILKTQAYESANFSGMTAAQSKKIVTDFIEAGERFVKSMEEIKLTQEKTNSLKLKSASDLPCSPVDFIPDATSGISPGLVKTVGDLIAETKGDVAALQKKLDNKEIDEDTFNEALNQMRVNKTTKAANVGLGAVVGTGAALGAGLIVGATTLPAIATVTAVGVVVGTSVTWFANWYSGVKSTSSTTKHYIISGKTEVGGRLPVHLLEEGANMSIVIDGYAPVFLSNFSLPAAGHNKTISITPVKLSEAEAGGTAEVCLMDEMLTASSCDAVEFVMASPSPLDPAPGQGVTVTATIIPMVQGCSLTFTITGTDGYSKSETKTTNSSGQASFYVPGGAKDVFDKVTINTSNGKSYLVTYTF